jgi:V/A-type H+-transporting ATPase subunit I
LLEAIHRSVAMIIKMSKVEIVGPREHLLAALELLRGKGVFHPEADRHGFVSTAEEKNIRELLLDEDAVGEKLYFTSLQERINELLACLPDLPSRTSYLQPLPIVDVLNELVDKHLADCRNRQQQLQTLREELESIARYLHFWTVLEPLVAEVGDHSQLCPAGATGTADRRALPTLHRQH